MKGLLFALGCFLTQAQAERDLTEGDNDDCNGKLQNSATAQINAVILKLYFLVILRAGEKQQEAQVSQKGSLSGIHPTGIHRYDDA